MTRIDGSTGWAPPWWLLLAALAFLSPDRAVGETQELDCLADSPDCPEIVIAGDPHFELPGFGPAPFRGYGDPSMRQVPGGDRLWMTYSRLWVAFDPADPSVAEPTVSIHLASSDDGGATWRFRRRLWTSKPETDPAPPSGRGLSVHEVSALAPAIEGGELRWYGASLRYHLPFGGEARRPGSFHFRLARARGPKKLRRARQARLGGPLTEAVWDLDVDLSTLHPDLADCSIWTEPSLFASEGSIHLVAQCLVIDERTGKRRRKKEFVGVFASAGGEKADRLEWSWLGKLTTRSDARALGGHVLTQPEVTTSRDGTLLLLVTPKKLAPVDRHLGCRALELASLDPPRLRRSATGKPIVRADVRSSDSTGLGPGLCTYDPASSTGILFVRTEADLELPEIVFRLHATGIHP